MRPFCTVGQLISSQVFDTNTQPLAPVPAFTIHDCRKKASYGHNTSAYCINRTHHDSTGYADLGRQHANAKITTALAIRPGRARAAHRAGGFRAPGRVVPAPGVSSYAPRYVTT